MNFIFIDILTLKKEEILGACNNTLIVHKNYTLDFQ